MTDKTTYAEEKQQELKTWEDKINELENKIHSGTVEASDEAKKQLIALRAKKEHLEEKLGEIKSSSEDAWEPLKDGVKRVQDDLSQMFNDISSKFKDN